jgi:hypothetical protein
VLEEELLVFISNTGTGPVPSCFDRFPLEDNEDSPFWILKRFSPTKAPSRVAASNCSREKVPFCYHSKIPLSIDVCQQFDNSFCVGTVKKLSHQIIHRQQVFPRKIS